MENPFETIEQRLLAIEGKLDSLIQKMDNPENLSPKWINSKQLAQHLGISTAAVANLRINKIPYYKIGGRILYKKQEIDEFIEKTRHKSGGEYLDEYLNSRQGKDRLSQSRI
ncbi:MAG: helix-turn-helix domain-containing protein [Bacteroidales bacterium]|nr:helix-turn-helix domain-containing protein [Bacteroidales bacterium]